MNHVTLNPEQVFSLESRLEQLHSLGLLLTQVRTKESQKVERATLADLGRVIVFLAEATQDEFFQSPVQSLILKS